MRGFDFWDLIVALFFGILVAGGLVVIAEALPTASRSLGSY